MNLTKMLFVVNTAVVVALAQAPPPEQCLMCRSSALAPGAPAERLGPSFTGDNIESVVHSIKSDSTPKSEFETTAAYEARRNAIRRDGSAFVFVFDEQHFSYDADSEMMTAAVSVDKRRFYMIQDNPEYSVLKIRHALLSRTEYIGSNAYGAEARVSNLISQEFGLIIDQPLGSMLFIPMNPAVAQDVKPYLRMGLACTLSKSVVLQDSTRREPTITDPVDSFTNYFYLPVVVTEMFVFDRRDGAVLLRVHLNSSDDLVAQREFKKKLFPIELYKTDWIAFNV